MLGAEDWGAVGRLCVALAFAAAALGLALALAAPPGASAAHDGNDADGPLDIVSTGFDQSGKRVILRLETHGRWRPGTLAASPRVGPGANRPYVCFELRQDGRLERDCVTTSPSGHTVLESTHIGDSGARLSQHRITAVRIARPNKRSVRLSGPIGAFGLGPGVIGWRAITEWTGPGCLAATAGERPCADSSPNNGLADGRVKRPHIIGCRPGSDLVHTRGPGARNEIALTFDDGPSTYTSQVLDVLRHKHAKGTFFQIGQEIPGREATLRRILREGHELANHSLHHETLPSAASMRETNDRIRAATGFQPCLFRPPGGAISSAVTHAAHDLGMTTVLWEVDTNNWQTPGSGAIYSRVVGSAHAGSIVLMHDGGGDRSQTVAALPAIIDTLKHRGYRLVTVSRLLRQKMVWSPR